MDHVRIYTAEDVARLTRKRTGEEKIGQHVQVATGDWKDSLKNDAVRFVLFGVAEDIGVKANFGRPGAATAFKPALESFLNEQSNLFLRANEVLVLGELEVQDLMEEAANLDPRNPAQLKRLRELVSVIDQRLVPVVKEIITAGKILLLVGGGHNNAYGNIAGTASALGKKISVINCDPHLDFRATEGRHSGNGFSYAYGEGLMHKYAVLCMHEQYNNQAALETFRDQAQQLFYRSYESVFVRAELNYTEALTQCISFVNDGAVGLELDLDAITNVPSSAKTSSGISPVQARQFVYASARQLKPRYFHIAEGAPVLSHIKADNKTGKLIAYLLSDFIKGVGEAS